MKPGKKGGHWRKAHDERDLRWRCEERLEGYRDGWRRCLYRRRDNPKRPTEYSYLDAEEREK
jgi:hypothetical protein